MAELYEDDGMDEVSPQAAEMSEPADKSASAQTGLLPLSFFGEPPEPGTTFSGRVVKVYDDQVEVEMGNEAEEEAAEGSPPEMMSMMGDEDEAMA